MLLLKMLEWNSNIARHETSMTVGLIFFCFYCFVLVFFCFYCFVFLCVCILFNLIFVFYLLIFFCFYCFVLVGFSFACIVLLLFFVRVYFVSFRFYFDLFFCLIFFCFYCFVLVFFSFCCFLCLCVCFVSFPFCFPERWSCIWIQACGHQ